MTHESAVKIKQINIYKMFYYLPGSILISRPTLVIITMFVVTVSLMMS